MTLHIREITNEEGNRLSRLVKTTSSVVTMRRAQCILHSAQGFSPPWIAGVLFMSPAWVRHIVQAFNEDGFESLYARYRGGGHVKFEEEVRLEIVSLATSRPRDLGLPYNDWSLSKLQEEAVKRGIVPAISQERLRTILHEEAVTFQAAKTWKVSTDPEFEAKKRRIGRLTRKRKNPPVVIAIDQLGPLQLRPQAGEGWARSGHPHRNPATYTRTGKTRQFLVAMNFHRKTFVGRLRRRKRGKENLGFLKEVRRHYAPEVRIHVIQDNFAAQWTPDIRRWARANRVTLVATATNASWMNPVECHLTDIRKLALRGSDWRTWGQVDEALQGATKYKTSHRGSLPRKVTVPLWRGH